MLINSNRHINTQTFWRKKFYCEYFTVGIRHLAISRDQWHKYHHNDVLIQVSWVGLHGPLYPWGILRSHIFYQKVIFLLETNNDTDFLSEWNLSCTSMDHLPSVHCVDSTYMSWPTSLELATQLSTASWRTWSTEKRMQYGVRQTWI